LFVLVAIEIRLAIRTLIKEGPAGHATFSDSVWRF